MTDKRMTPKWWLYKSNTKASNSAAGFIQQYRDFLLTGELATVVSPIIDRLDSREIYPTPALNEIQNAVMSHILEVATRKVEADIQVASQEKEQTATKKNWNASIYNAAGELQTRIAPNGKEEDLSKEFELSQRARSWVDLRLFDGASDWYAEITHSLSSCKEIVFRGDAISRILAKKKGPTCHEKSKTTRTLGFEVHAKQDRASFSRG